MSNRAAKIAGPMLAKRDAQGNAKLPAKPEEVVKALRLARTTDCVVREWENEAHRRNGGKGSVELAGYHRRSEQRNLRLRELEMQDRRAKANTREFGYRPGVVARLLARLSEHLKVVHKRKAQRRARKITRTIGD